MAIVGLQEKSVFSFGGAEARSVCTTHLYMHRALHRGYWSLEVTDNVTVRQRAYDFPFVFNRNYLVGIGASVVFPLSSTLELRR